MVLDEYLDWPFRLRQKTGKWRYKFEMGKLSSIFNMNSGIINSATLTVCYGRAINI